MSDVNLSKSLEAGFLPSDEMLKRYKELAPSLADRLEKAVKEARELSYIESQYAGFASPMSRSKSTTLEKIVYTAAAFTLMAPAAVLVSILYLIFSK